MHRSAAITASLRCTATCSSSSAKAICGAWCNGTQLTHDADILRFDLEVSSDGRWIAHDDKNQKLYVYDAQSKAQRLVASSRNDGFNYWWTKDNKLLYVESSANTNGVDAAARAEG